VPFFTEISRRARLTVYGRLVEMTEHSVEPTCPKCKAWVEADEVEARALAAKWDAEDAAKRLAVTR